MFEDIKDYGTYTAIYQKEHRFLRTPIVLAPACTTRAADYYVWGQGQYLAAGLKMVLCNYGGSCFIGQDSWDNRKLIHDENKIDNTIYHGLKPGMYRQSSQHKDRGALGDHEQALLIYDVNPAYEKATPLRSLCWTHFLLSPMFQFSRWIFMENHAEAARMKIFVKLKEWEKRQKIFLKSC